MVCPKRPHKEKKGMAEAIPLQNHFFRDLRSST
jgi:hypothetical protein